MQNKIKKQRIQKSFNQTQGMGGWHTNNNSMDHTQGSNWQANN